jgi:hypothetical protein
LSRVLTPYQVTARDGLLVPGLTLTATGGRHVLVADLDALWAAAARLTGRAIDPLTDD